jgi:hypothetical protein
MVFACFHFYNFPGSFYFIVGLGNLNVVIKLFCSFNWFRQNKAVILLLKSQYIFTILLFLAKNRDLHESNSEIHNFNTRSSSDLHTSTTNLTTFQKYPFYFGIKVFNYFPTSIKNTSHYINQFRSVLKSFLLINPF